VVSVPSGTVTFLFTDLEGSTRLWDEHPELMSAALARHDEMLHSVIRARSGVVFSGMGDGVAASFDRATDAVHAAMDIQAAVTEEPWPEALGPLRVRMGLHTGEAEIRDASYYGGAVNRAARVMAIAWGGQVVCTATTASLLAEDVELCDLGEHRLRDLSRPERVWQLGSSASFPPLRSGSNLPGNLPTQVTEFVGRAAELQSLHEAVESARVVTLTGVGGAGKTRLALQFAAEAQPEFRNGAWLCDLAPLTSPDAVAPAVAAVIGVEPGGDGAWTSAIADALAERQLLLVLDNCEHVLDAVATLVDSLMRSCPNVVVVSTSREGLGVPGERIMPVGSLALPRIDEPLDAARTTDAVNLFVSRARDVRPLEIDDPEILAAVTQICRRLDGIPLALELAAARTQSMSVNEIARHLDDRFGLLTRGARTALARHQTLRAAIDWSFDLLDEAEQRVLMRVSVFAGGFTLDAATAVCEPSSVDTIGILDQLDGLVRRSMIITDEDATRTRYRTLETIRQYAAERLEGSGDTTDTSRAHLDWCATFAREAGEHLRGPEDATWIAAMERELDNTRIALEFAVASGALDAAQALLSAAPVGALWDSRLGASMATLAEEVAPKLRDPDHPVEAALLTLLALGAALRFAGDEAVELAQRACDVARRHDNWMRTGPWLALFLASLIAGRNETAMAAAREALTRATAEADAFAVAEWHAQLGVAHWIAGDVDEAQRLTGLGLSLAEEIGADNLVMRNAFVRGATLLVPGSDPAIAFQHLQRAVRLGERVGGNVLYGGAAWAVLLSKRGTKSSSAAALARELASNLPTPMFMLDGNGMMVFYNDATADVLGKPFAEVGMIGAAEFGGSLDLATLDGQPLRRRDTPAGVAFFQRRPIHQTLRATSYNGHRSAYDATAHPLYGPAGEWEGIVCVFWAHTSAPA
jgi:predicted ATPase/class 3 adenylate cyclase